jgi:hypothetical protein
MLSRVSVLKPECNTDTERVPAGTSALKRPSASLRMSVETPLMKIRAFATGLPSSEFTRLPSMTPGACSISLAAAAAAAAPASSGPDDSTSYSAEPPPVTSRIHWLYSSCTARIC